MKNSILIAFSVLCVWVFMNVLFTHKSVHAQEKEFIWADSGALVIIENAESSELSLDENGNWDIKVEPSKTERTYIYGESGELTVIQPSSLGTFAY